MKKDQPIYEEILDTNFNNVSLSTSPTTAIIDAANETATSPSGEKSSCSFTQCPAYGNTLGKHTNAESCQRSDQIMHSYSLEKCPAYSILQGTTVEARELLSFSQKKHSTYTEDTSC